MCEKNIYFSSFYAELERKKKLSLLLKLLMIDCVYIIFADVQ